MNRKYVVFFFLFRNTETEIMAEGNRGEEQEMRRWKIWLSRPWPFAPLPAPNV